MRQMNKMNSLHRKGKSDLSLHSSLNPNKPSLRASGSRGIKILWSFTSKSPQINSHLNYKQRKNNDISISSKLCLSWKTWTKKRKATHIFNLKKYRNLRQVEGGKKVRSTLNLFSTNQAQLLQLLLKQSLETIFSLDAEAEKNSQTSKRSQQVEAMYNLYGSLNLVKREIEYTMWVIFFHFSPLIL